VGAVHGATDLRTFLLHAQDRTTGSLSERGFTKAYSAWFSHPTECRSAEPSLSEAEVAQVMVELGWTQQDQLLISALLANEHNRQCFHRYRKLRQRLAVGGEGVDGLPGSPSWLQAADKLFFLVDSGGTGHVTVGGTSLFL